MTAFLHVRFLFQNCRFVLSFDVAQPTERENQIPDQHHQLKSRINPSIYLTYDQEQQDIEHVQLNSYGVRPGALRVGQRLVRRL